MTVPQPEFRAPRSAAQPPASQPPQPEFREPKAGGYDPVSHPGRYSRTKEEIDRRLSFLSKIGRRCDANGRRCWKNRATRRLRVQKFNPQTREPVGEPYDVLTCSQHTQVWEKSGQFEVLSKESLVDAPEQGS